MGRIWTVGDIHGRLDKLLALLDQMEIDPAEDELVFLGDYIDRGPESKEVVDHLIGLAKSGLKCTFLKGNHEEMFLDYRLTGQNPLIFLYNGGTATLNSYGQADAAAGQVELPAEHEAFYQELLLYYQKDGYLFVHAGLRPWIREEFYWSDFDWPYKIVFGHTPFREPFRRGGLFGIDTGAVYGGVLTCLVLPEEKFLQA
jgi:serine/threonine protein phosphatase 1